ncbi:MULTISPECIES: glycosyltransferase [unclassified Leptolyngbya]|uniref:glycosyltransferase family 2 protein n=1 Tax=unclassified Leptolyngbya TaxID=2650499 RepID=UPI0016894BD9|nr:MULTISPECIES: glycosyltransferase [unclassified Leptolyngbya]MBD1913106.1 glycosyltransferase [Leptolyngbya sp. FACHB-8]MBD2153242.1 glycosyltransferase [Leptolyngbya sp. FACHB-16]
MSLSNIPSVSVIVPVYNGGEAFLNCCNALKTACPAPLEVIVVVDGQDDASTYVAKQHGFRVVNLPTNRGPAVARNYGAKISSGDILFFVDADVQIAPNVIDTIQTLFLRSSDLSAVIGSYDDAPGCPDFLSQYRNLFHHYTHQISDENASTFWGACGAIRREAFFAINGFDERFRRPCVEDIDLGYRLRNAGYQIRLCKNLQVKHLKRWGLVTLLKADFFYRALPWTQLILENKALNNDLNLQTSSRVSVVLAYGFVAALLLSPLWQLALLVAFFLGAGLLWINASVYRFFKRKRGLKFALGTIPMHWLYYLYGGLGFAIGCCQYWLSSLMSTLSFPTLASENLDA